MLVLLSRIQIWFHHLFTALDRDTYHRLVAKRGSVKQSESEKRNACSEKKRTIEKPKEKHRELFQNPLVTEAKSEEKSQRKLEVGELVWGAARGSPAWPGKVESLGPPGTMTVWVRWYGGGGGRSQVEVKALKSLSEGLEAHHRARKKFRK